MSNIDQEFVEFIVKSLVGNPDKVKIVRTIDEKGVLLELTVDQEDLGRVIGKRGNTAQSIRTLLRALGTKNDARYNLKIIDPEGGERPPRPERTERRDNYSSPAPFTADPVTPADPIAQTEPAAVDETPAPVSDGASQWAHLSSADDTPGDDASSATPVTDDDEDENDDDVSSSSVVEKTREELADLDGLDI